MKYERHPNPTMGLVWLPSESALVEGEQLHAFPLSDDEQSVAYLAWLQTQPPE